MCRCRKVTTITVTDDVIKAVEAMTSKQGFHTLTFKNRDGTVFNDAHWVAGVDYDDVEDNETDETKVAKDDG